MLSKNKLDHFSKQAVSLLGPLPLPIMFGGYTGTNVTKLFLSSLMLCNYKLDHLCKASIFFVMIITNNVWRLYWHICYNFLSSSLMLCNNKLDHLSQASIFFVKTITIANNIWRLYCRICYKTFFIFFADALQ